MFDLSNPRTWQDITNWILVLVAFIAAVYIGLGMYKEARRRVRRTEPARHTSDTHTFVLPDLGITMADGGEHLDGQEDRESGS